MASRKSKNMHEGHSSSKRPKEQSERTSHGDYMATSDSAGNNGTESVSTESETDGQEQITHICKEINKRSIGTAILKFCGNEGTENDENKATLRRLMQAVISHIELEEPDVWKNAEVKIYDDNCDIYSIRAGHGRVLFLATFDGMGNPKVIKTKRSRVGSNSGEHAKNCSLM